MKTPEFVGVVCLVAGLGCRTDTVSAPAPPQPGLTRAEYIAACLHRPDAKMRLYGCSPWVYASQAQPLIIIDGQRLPTGTGWWARRRREAALRGIRPTEIAALTVISPADTAAVAPYGPAGWRGVILITTKRGATRSPPAT